MINGLVKPSSLGYTLNQSQGKTRNPKAASKFLGDDLFLCGNKRANNVFMPLLGHIRNSPLTFLFRNRNVLFHKIDEFSIYGSDKNDWFNLCRVSVTVV